MKVRKFTSCTKVSVASSKRFQMARSPVCIISSPHSFLMHTGGDVWTQSPKKYVYLQSRLPNCLSKFNISKEDI